MASDTLTPFDTPEDSAPRKKSGSDTPGPLRVDYLPKMNRPVLVAAFDGWNDAGQAATRAVAHLVRTLGAQSFAHLAADEFYLFSQNRPRVRLDAEGRRRVRWQPNEFYHAKAADGTDIVLFLGTEPNLRWQTYGSALMAMIHRLGIERVYLLGAYLSDALYTDPVEVQQHAYGVGLPPEMAPFNYEGETGIVGLMAAALEEARQPMVNLWASVPYYITLANPRASLALLRHVESLTGTTFNLKDLEKEAEDFQEKVAGAMAADPQAVGFLKEMKKQGVLN
ncbi:MAG: PAC2 family protein [Deltaproteobacteria bacterium]|nr:PAC2 family protein [Deltaproteobacteria bacterium]